MTGLRQPFRTRVLAAFALAAAFVHSAAAETTRNPEGPTPQDGYFEEVQKLDPGVWLIRQAKPFHLQPIGNVTVVEQADGLVMVDSGGTPGSGRRIVGLIRSLSRKPVKAVIISQWHGDKPLGLPAVLAAWPDARVISTEATRAHLGDPATMNAPAAFDPAANKAMLDKYRGYIGYGRQMAGKARTPAERAGWEAMARLFTQYVQDMDGAITVQPGEGFTDRLELPDAARPVQAMFLGKADTDGDAVVWLPRQRILVAGETVVLPIPFGFEAYPAEWIQVLRRIGAYDFRILVPGHGAPQHDRRYVGRLIALIQAVQDQVRPLVAQGLTLDQIQAKVSLDDEATRFVRQDPWLRQWFEQYWTRPIVTSAYREAKGEPIVQRLAG